MPPASTFPALLDYSLPSALVLEPRHWERMGAGESSEGRELGSDGLAMALMDLKRRKASGLLTEAQYDAGEPKRIPISEQF